MATETERLTAHERMCREAEEMGCRSIGVYRVSGSGAPVVFSKWLTPNSETFVIEELREGGVEVYIPLDPSTSMAATLDALKSYAAGS
jgi:hypothetical protein